MKKTFKICTRFGAFVAAVIAAAPVSAVLNDPPYFNLWAGGQVDAAGLKGSGTQVLLCGTDTCGASPTTSTTPITDYSDRNYAILNALPKNNGKGSGAIDPFLRFDHNVEGAGGTGQSTTEAAYNTDFRQSTTGQQIGALGTVTSPNTPTSGTSTTIGNQAKDDGAGGKPGFNHAVKFSSLVFDANGYYHFLLDINEPGSDKATLRLDELAFFTSASNTLHDFVRDDPNTPDPITGADGHFADATASTKIWDMDFNNLGNNGTSMPTPPTGVPDRIGGLILDSAINNTNGSGDFDMEILLHKDLFKSVQQSDYVYLYNFAGSADKCTSTDLTCGLAQSGFEEWAVDLNPTTTTHEVPEPASLGLVMAGLAVGHWARRKKHAAKPL